MEERFATVEDLQEIFEREGRGLYNYLVGLSRSPDDAQDHLQSIFLKFIEQVKRGRILYATAGAYLVRMAHNEWAGNLRKQAREFLAEGELLDRLPARVVPPEIEDNGHIAVQVLAETIVDPEVPEKIREVLRLRFWEDLPVDEICARLNKPRSTVYASLRSGVSILAKAFAKAGLTSSSLDEGAK